MPKAKIFSPESTTPFALNRSKVELFMDYPRCFYLDRRLGISRPAGLPFNLNSAVDALLKTGFGPLKGSKPFKSGVSRSSFRLGLCRITLR